jgi:hypothetical protein
MLTFNPRMLLRIVIADFSGFGKVNTPWLSHDEYSVDQHRLGLSRSTAFQRFRHR